MLISTQKLKVAFKKAMYVIEHKQRYLLGGNRMLISIDDLCYVISDMYDIKINIHLVDFNSTHLRGMMERYNHGGEIANVYIKKSQDPEWRRFIAAKELSQIVIDEEEDWNPLGVDTIDGLINEEQFPQNSESCAPTHLQSEMLAQAVALEIMFPFKARTNFRGGYKNGVWTLDDISQNFGIPEYAINWVFSDDYHALASKTWEDVL